ncbi:protein D3-like [Eupeodes corollae]|uniref:protein D3-like n=1 Tax=Eupeodes corollae TaxID=290404 RepID=UPI002491C97D|nr:protein D3-like [Eupeodes corollae]
MNKAIFGILTISLFCLTWAESSKTSRTRRQFNIADNAEILKVTFESAVSVDMGNEITPYQAKNISKVDWDADENAYYTIICTDPDAPSPGDPFLGELITWLVVNIPGKSIASGKILAEYFAAAPPKGAKLNRIVYLLYKQPSELEFDEKPIDKFTFEGRSNFSSEEFSSKYGLGDPIAFNYYLTEFDEFVREVYKQLNCCIEFNSPKYHYT